MVSLLQWLKTLFLAAIFGIIGIIVFMLGAFLMEFNSILGFVILIIGIVFLASAAYFWRHPSGTFR